MATTETNGQLKDAIGYNHPLHYSSALLCHGLKLNRRCSVVGYSVSPSFANLLGEGFKTDLRLCGQPVLFCKDLQQGVIIHYSDGSAVWWQGDDTPDEIYWPYHLSPDDYFREPVLFLKDKGQR
jgi:hypothetical protein